MASLALELAELRFGLGLQRLGQRGMALSSMLVTASVLLPVALFGGQAAALLRILQTSSSRSTARGFPAAMKSSSHQASAATVPNRASGIKLFERDQLRQESR